MATSQLDSLLMSSIKAMSQGGEIEIQQQPVKIPDYINKDHFTRFLAKNKSELQANNSGYIVILTDKDEYQAGDLVKGTVYLELFHSTT